MTGRGGVILGALVTGGPGPPWVGQRQGRDCYEQGTPLLRVDLWIYRYIGLSCTIQRTLKCLKKHRDV